MFCSQCGRALAEDNQFCPGCGKETGQVSVPPLDRLERPGVITLLAILHWLGGLVLLALAVGARYGLAQAEDTRTMAIALAAVLGVLGVLQLACGVGLFGLRPWGRWLQIGLAILGLLAIPVGTLISGLVLYYMFRPGIKALYAGKPASALTPAEVQAIRGLGSSALIVAIAALVLLLFITAYVGIVAAIAVPNLLNAIQRGKQKRTMSDLRTIGTAIESYQVDHGSIPQVSSGADARAALRAHLEPTFVKVMPGLDGWQHPFGWESDGASYTVTSLGKDGRPDAAIDLGATTAFNADIYFSDGQFTRYPEGTQQ